MRLKPLNRTWRAAGLIGPIAWLAAGCSGGGERRCATGLLAGDLAISEIMANPYGKDEGKEWFEIYNPTSAKIDLTGLRLEAAREDGTGAYNHLMRRATIAPGQYLVLGGMLEEIKPAWVNYAYAADLGALRNTGGRLGLYCGEALVDRVIYETMQDGVSRAFDGDRLPDSIANDDLAYWCDSSSEYEPSSFGTPGAANDSCGVSPQGECNDGGQLRSVRPPTPGDLTITEVMADPKAVDDALGEWFEVFVAADLDLNGLELGRIPPDVGVTLTSRDCLPAAAGSFLVFARNADFETNGGLPRVDFTFGFALQNSNGSLFVGHGGEVLDQVAWSSSRAGVASSLDPELTDPLANDDPASWCPATSAYGDGDLGTPGEINDSCGFVPEGQCNDGGQFRPVSPPAPGDLVLTEVMADPKAVDDPLGEWFEVFVAADLDLNGLELGRIPPDVGVTLTSRDCLRAAAGSFLVFARNNDPELNGGLPRVDFTFGFALLNSNGNLFVGHGGEVLDQVAWSSSRAGVSTSLDPDHTDPAANDDPANWCPGIDAYGDGDLGTPGEINPSCP